MAGRNTLLKTTDGGETWSNVVSNLSAPEIAVGGIYFIDELRGWAATSTERSPAVWQTLDGGRSWQLQQRWPVKHPEWTATLIDVHFRDALHGWAVGMMDGKALIAGTRDGGRTWKLQYKGSEITGQFNRVRFTDVRNGWALANEAVLYTDDGGKHWRIVRYEPPLLNDISPLGGESAWVAGAWGRLLRSDRGRWSQVRSQEPGSKEFFGFVHFVNEQRGWASGVDCNIMTTADAGRTWTRESCPLTPPRQKELATGEMAHTNSLLFMLCSSGYVLVRRIDPAGPESR